MIKILIAGDFCPQGRVADLIKFKKYSNVFGNISALTKEYDYSIVNLECSVVSGVKKPIFKWGPNLKTTENALESLKFSGFSIVTLANNHFYDYGDYGVNETLSSCKKQSIDFVGGGRNLKEAQNVLYKKNKDKTIAFVNFCENEFSIATDKTGGSNPLDPINNYYQIKEATIIADYVIVIVHGGHEHYQLPSPRMKKTYRFFIDAGASVVINHHQHCYSGYEIYNNKPIFYGLGNFCFDKDGKRNSSWNEGYLVSLKFEADKVAFELIPYTQGDEKAGIVLSQDEIKVSMIDKIEYLNKIISNDSLLNEYFMKFVASRKKNLDMLFEPYNNRFLKSLRIRGLLPSFINKRKTLQLFNYIICESHRDTLIYNFKNKL